MGLFLDSQFNPIDLYVYSNYDSSNFFLLYQDCFGYFRSVLFVQCSPEAEPMGCLFICWELAHMIMDADNSQDLQVKSAGWRLRRVNGVVPVWAWRPEDQESWWCISSLKTGRLDTEEYMFQFKSEDRKKMIY